VIIIEIATAMIVTQTGTAMAAMTEIKGTGIGEIAIAAIGTVDSRSSGNFRDAARHIRVQILGDHLGKVVAEIALPHVLHGRRSGRCFKSDYSIFGYLNVSRIGTRLNRAPAPRLSPDS
jgi:hypothetical protein